ncbi:MAG: hypothetical protein JF609_00735 [Verrucomicrobia bacterium]|nr:hypothetical protein [Verrucomicrobiota bacterium]
MNNIASAQRRRSEMRGFSLVEVVLALGVISIGVVSLIGLLIISTSSSRLSDEDTVFAAIARQVDTELHNTTFADLPTNGATWYFDNEGHHLTTAANAVYQCRIILTADTDYDSPGAIRNLYRAELLFSRALGANAPVMQSTTTALYRND